MFLSTLVWIFYTFVNLCDTNMNFAELVSSDIFERTQTCGAVYGFATGILTFIFCYAGEFITRKVAGDIPDTDQEE